MAENASTVNKDQSFRDLARWLFAQGVDPEHTIHPPLGPVNVARILKLDCGLFDYDPDRGQPAFLHPVYDRHYDAYDCVAWFRSAPATLYRYTGIAHWLGEDSVTLSETTHRALRIRLSPLDWLKAGGDGAVMLEPDICRCDLMRIQTVVAPNIRVGGYLDKLVRPVADWPKIQVAR